MEIVNHEYYVSLEIAKLLKQLGFDWECREYYPTSFIACRYEEYAKPTLEVAQRWLREVKHLDVIVNRNFPIHEHKYSWEYEYVIITTDGRVEAVDCYFDEYEQAQESGIKKALEIILEEGE